MANPALIKNLTGYWECKECSSDNARQLMICEFCETPRGFGLVARSQEAEGELPERWKREKEQKEREKEEQEGQARKEREPPKQTNQEREKQEREKQEWEKQEKEKQEREKQERERQEKERQEKERQERERQEREKQAAARRLPAPADDEQASASRWFRQRRQQLQQELRSLEGSYVQRRQRLRQLQLELHPDKQEEPRRKHAQLLFLLVQAKWEQCERLEAQEPKSGAGATGATGATGGSGAGPDSRCREAAKRQEAFQRPQPQEREDIPEAEEVLAPEAVSLHVSDLAGHLCTLQADRSWLILDVKARLEEVSGLGRERQRLLLGPRDVDDYAALKSLPAGSEVSLVLVECLERYYRKELFLSELRSSWKALQYASAALRADWAVLEIAMAQDWRAWEFAAPSLQRHPKVVQRVLDADGLALEKMCRQVRGDPQHVLRAVRQTWRALQFAAPDLRKNPSVVRAALAQDVRAMDFADKELLGDHAFAVSAVWLQGLALRYLATSLRGDRELVALSCQKDPRAIAFAAPELFGDAKFKRSLQGNAEAPKFLSWSDEKRHQMEEQLFDQYNYAALDDERQLSTREREVLAERLRFAEAEDEAARERLARALSSLRSRGREGTEEAAAQQSFMEDRFQRLHEECSHFQVAYSGSEQRLQAVEHAQEEAEKARSVAEHEVASLLFVQREQNAQLALVGAERQRLTQELAQLQGVPSESERKLREELRELSERASHWRSKAEAETEEKEKVAKALTAARKEQDERVGQLSDEMSALRQVDRGRQQALDRPPTFREEVPGSAVREPVSSLDRSDEGWRRASPHARRAQDLRQEMTSWLKGESTETPQWRRAMSPRSELARSQSPKLAASTRAHEESALSMLELRCQELQSRLERALLDGAASRQRALELELQLECEMGDSRARMLAKAPEPVEQSLELKRKTATLEAEMKAARAQAQAAKSAEESALAALTDSERRCRDGLRRMDAMLSDTKELTRELAKHKYLAQALSEILRTFGIGVGPDAKFERPTMLVAFGVGV
ncbi:unnamed protein product [Effrenium voratum]|nr:unnamed protein product [Effrenium voratum]